MDITSCCTFIFRSSLLWSQILPSLLENVSLRVPTRCVTHFSVFSGCLSIKFLLLGAPTRYAANAVRTLHIRILEIRAVPLTHILQERL
jgi:hypothetical protein